MSEREQVLRPEPSESPDVFHGSMDSLNVPAPTPVDQPVSALLGTPTPSPAPAPESAPTPDSQPTPPTDYEG